MTDGFLEELNQKKKSKEEVASLKLKQKERENEVARKRRDNLEAVVDQYLNNKFLEFVQIIESTCLEASEKALYIQENDVNVIRGSIVIEEKAKYLSVRAYDDCDWGYFDLHCVIWTPIKIGLLSRYNKHYDQSFCLEDDMCSHSVNIYTRRGGAEILYTKGGEEKIPDYFITKRLCEIARRKTEQCLVSVLKKNIPSIELSKKWVSGKYKFSRHSSPSISKLDFTLKF